MRSTSDTYLASRLRLAVTRTARRLRQEAGGGLSPSLMAALATIEHHGPMTPSEVASRERIQRPTATRVIARLTEAGLVARTRDPVDGRSSLISITADGRALIAELRIRKDLYLAHRLEGLPDSERETLARAADILERLLEDGE